MFGRKFKKGDRVIVNDLETNIVNEIGTVVKTHWFRPFPYDVTIDSFQSDIMGEFLDEFFGSNYVPFNETHLTKADPNV